MPESTTNHHKKFGSSVWDHGAERSNRSTRTKKPLKQTDFRGFSFWIGKPPALPVEEPRKKALASSNERSELVTANYQGRKTYVRTAVARLRAAGQVMRVK